MTQTHSLTPAVYDFSAELAVHPKQWGPYFTHDPSTFRDPVSGMYYTYSTDTGVRQGVAPGIQIRRSRDLISWEYVGQAMDGIPEEAEAYAHPVNLWAPDICRVEGEYRLYYSASTFGSIQSAIMLAVADHPEGPFRHRATVLTSGEESPVNAIDPNVVTDPKDGKIYLVYGSYWGGIRLLELDPATGLARQEGYGTPLACRSPLVNTAVEGPYLIYNPETEYYYLFVSYGGLSHDYHLRVGRSPTIEGPYLDRNHLSLTDMDAPPERVGTMILCGYRFSIGAGWKATGHCCVLRDGADWFLIHHARPDSVQNFSVQQVRRLLWLPDGWPAVSPECYAGERPEQEVPVANLPGRYERICLEPLLPQTVMTPAPAILRLDSTCRTASLNGTWRRPGPHTVLIRQAGREEILEAQSVWDEETRRPTIVLTGLDDRGVAVWYKKLD